MSDKKLKLVIFDIKKEIEFPFENIFGGKLDIALEANFDSFEYNLAECLVISDSGDNIKKAKSKGISCIGYIGGAHKIECVSDIETTCIASDMSGADYLIESFESLDAD